MTTAQDPRAQGQRQAYVWYAIVLLSVVYMINYMDRMALAVLAPAIKQELQLTDGQLGVLLGLAFSLFFAVCGIPIARWADRGNRRNIIAVSLVAWSVMTALSGIAQNFWHLFAARIGVGAGEAGCTPPSQSMICDYVPVRRRSGAFAVHQCGLYAGMMFGMALAGWLGQSVGWRLTFLILGLPGILVAAVVMMSLREPERGCFDTLKDDGSDRTLRRTLGVLWGCKTYRLLVVFCVANGFAQIGLSQWWPSFYTRVHGLSMSFTGVYLGLAIGIGSVTGLLIGGQLANRLAQTDVRLPLVLAAVSTIMAVPAGISSLFVGSPVISLALVIGTTLLWTVPAGPAAAALYSVTRSWMRATAGAVATFSVAVIGYSLGPFCVGILSDMLTPSLSAESLRYAMLVPILALPVMTAALWGAAKELPRDLTAAGALLEDPASRVEEGRGFSDISNANNAAVDRVQHEPGARPPVSYS